MPVPHDDSLYVLTDLRRSHGSLRKSGNGNALLHSSLRRSGSLSASGRQPPHAKSPAQAAVSTPATRAPLYSGSSKGGGSSSSSGLVDRNDGSCGSPREPRGTLTPRIVRSPLIFWGGRPGGPKFGAKCVVMLCGPGQMEHLREFARLPQNRSRSFVGV
jgi:hypothetical protein